MLVSMSDMEKKCDEYKVCKNKIDELTKELEALKADIINDMEGQSEVKTEKYTVRNTLVTATRFDSKKFKEENSEIYNMYVKESNSTRFTIV